MGSGERIPHLRIELPQRRARAILLDDRQGTNRLPCDGRRYERPTTQRMGAMWWVVLGLLSDRVQVRWDDEQ
jgi:hypothetical protein